MGKLLCEKNVRDVWCRNESVRAEIGPILQTHTHTHTRVSYSSIDVGSYTLDADMLAHFRTSFCLWTPGGRLYFRLSFTHSST